MWCVVAMDTSTVCDCVLVAEWCTEEWVGDGKEGGSKGGREGREGRKREGGRGRGGGGGTRAVTDGRVSPTFLGLGSDLQFGGPQD